MDAYIRGAAEADFSRARNRETVQKILSLLNPSSRDLLSLREVREALHPRSESYRGLQVVPIAKIVGSEGRYADFNKEFLPKNDHLKGRWTRVDQAHLAQINLPPISLFEIGGVYFVRDGNHRVSVARQQGAISIDAEVISLDSKIRLSPDLTRDKLMEAVLEYEREQFMRTTRFDRIFPECQLRFSTTGRYGEILEHIYGHKYYINQNYHEELPFETAMRSWYENVYRPIVEKLREHKTLSRFPGRTEGDMYVWLVQHWDRLKQRCGEDCSLDKAVHDLTERFGRSVFQQIRDALSRAREARIRKRQVAKGEIIEP
jgi:hypothetical protein